MLKKVISGAQTGADIAGLRAARATGIPTGGWMTQGCKTTEGPHPDWLEMYQMKESADGGYPARTRRNVADADATIRLAFDFSSRGERCTRRAIDDLKRAYKDIDLDQLHYTPPKETAEWIKSRGIEILNVAGNSEKTNPGTFDAAYKYLLEVFKILGDTGYLDIG